MGSKGGFVLLGLLLILFALYHSSHGLECYSCLNPLKNCTAAINCSRNLDACLYVKAEERTYYQCWKFDNCNFEYISKALGENKLEYDCCQKNLCNRNDGARASGETFLLLTQLLAAFWKFFL
ncbi:CD59 glycoprotein [Pteropus alecto]|uniref:CD59 glycoprotein n=1 Tax=Pteropus alecto TaxID=9402 RepID=UPI0003F11385|nr:CD59 glycoprotein [Pteropus alecto]